MDNTPTLGEDPGSGGLDRRAVLRRGAILGGALVWTVPAVQTLAGPAFAAGTACVPDLVLSINGTCVNKTTYTDAAGAGSCCSCYTSTVSALGSVPGAGPIAVVLCQLNGQCSATTSSC
jgi:hypothetical protein